MSTNGWVCAGAQVFWVLGPRDAPGHLMIDGMSRGDEGVAARTFTGVQRVAGGQCLRGSWSRTRVSSGRASAGTTATPMLSGLALGQVRSVRRRHRRAPVAGDGTGGLACAPPTSSPAACRAAGRPVRNRGGPVMWCGMRSEPLPTVPSAATAPPTSPRRSTASAVYRYQLPDPNTAAPTTR